MPGTPSARTLRWKPRRWKRIRLRTGALWGAVAGLVLTLLSIAGEPGGLAKPLAYIAGQAIGFCCVTVPLTMWATSLRNRIAGVNRQ